MTTNKQSVSIAPENETMPKKEFQNVKLQEIQSNGGLRLALNSFAELEKFAGFMAISNFVPKHLRSKPADCLAVLLQSMRWEMDPFAVAQKTYFVNELMAYEAQLVNALIISRAPIKSRPDYKWSGEGENLECEISATFIGEDTPKIFTAKIKTITTRNSPLWKQQPAQQLAYFAARAFARIHCPDVIMGVYTKEEIENSDNFFGADNATDITPQPAIIEGIEAGIRAEKVVVQPQIIEAHDPETGEIIEEKPPTEDKQPLQPAKIPAKALASDPTKTDWDLWASEWERYVNGMADEQSLSKLKKLNESILNNMKDINPPKHAWCTELFTNRMVAVGGVKEAA